jgi:hypothetical protein
VIAAAEALADLVAEAAAAAVLAAAGSQMCSETYSNNLS